MVRPEITSAPHSRANGGARTLHLVDLWGSFAVMPPIPPPDASGFTTTTDVPLYWCRYGVPGARRLFVLHGGPGADHRYLLPQMLDLARDHELVFYDQRGGGQSRTDDATPVTWQAHVADLGAVATELGATPLELVGYSWGGLLSLLYAANTPARRPHPATLTLINPAPITRAHRAEFEAEFARRQQGETIQRLRAELAASGLRESDPAAYRQRGFELSVAGYFADPHRARDLTPFRVVGKIQQSVWQSLGDFDLRPALGRIHTPALVVHGRHDPIPLASSQSLAEALAARLVVLDDSGHVPYVEQAPSLFDAVRQFLTDNRPGDRGHAP
jgi:proline iminopeptidase